jgi:hypothetical protein
MRPIVCVQVVLRSTSFTKSVDVSLGRMIQVDGPEVIVFGNEKRGITLGGEVRLNEICIWVVVAAAKGGNENLSL